MRVRSIMLSTALLAGSVLLSAPATAAPPTVVRDCGAVVSGSAVLRSDLVCDTDVGLTLTAGTRLDLRGHRLVGGGNGTAVLVPPTGDVTIRGGTLEGWELGIGADHDPEHIPEGGQVLIDRVTVRSSDTGVQSNSTLVGQALSFTIRSSRFERNGTGLRGSFYSGSFEVESTRFTGNGAGISVDTSGAHVVDSRFDGNGTGLSCAESWCVALRSTFIRNGNGASIFSSDVDLQDSRFLDNEFAIRSSGWGSPVALTRLLVQDNGTGVELIAGHAQTTDSTFRGNRVAYVAEWSDVGWFEPGGSTLVGNTFVRNGDGVLAVTEGTELGDNTAVRNARWGIHAPGAVDLGGNTARGNGNDPQCVGVVCEGSGPRS